MVLLVERAIVKFFFAIASLDADFRKSDILVFQIVRSSGQPHLPVG